MTDPDQIFTPSPEATRDALDAYYGVPGEDRQYIKEWRLSQATMERLAGRELKPHELHGASLMGIPIRHDDNAVGFVYDFESHTKHVHFSWRQAETAQRLGERQAEQLLTGQEP